jgi:DNA-directed RNA polymerase sigma subunit (sigma70/sigma32)
MRLPEALLTDTRELAPEQMADLAMLRSEVTRSIQWLTDVERVVLQLRYGLDPFGISYSLEESARVLKCTRERIRGIECKALTKLRAPRRSQNLFEYAQSGSTPWTLECPYP